MSPLRILTPSGPVVVPLWSDDTLPRAYLDRPEPDSDGVSWVDVSAPDDLAADAVGVLCWAEIVTS